MYLFDYLQNSPITFYISMAVFGLIVGSFLNVVIYRLPKMLESDWQQQCRALLKLDTPASVPAEYLSLITPRSQCPQCSHKIAAIENIPVVSYLVLGGKCSACHHPIGVRYPVIELTSGILALFSAWHFGFGTHALLAALLAWALLTLSVIDIDQQLLPDDITLPFLWLGILTNLYGVFTNIHSSLIGAMAGYCSLWTVYKVFKLLTGKEGMGYGDFKLLAMLGAWLGWQMLPLIILLSSLAGAIIGIGLIMSKTHDKNIPIPFGPYLALAGWIALFWGHDINILYLRWSAGN
ncbi:MAG: Type 4 prepilin-like protein leader peptide-processing enzyme [Gammaproteobacteria bacterium]|nr:Type 4 prepilin-like protein leader peptide-processing enzyme [Gammaproteobacteria bacterium]